MFKITNNKGFHLTFENGLTISVQFGYGNYCENYMNHELSDRIKPAESMDAEIAIWGTNNEFITNDYIDCDGDSVIGSLKSDKVAELIYNVSNGIERNKEVI